MRIASIAALALGLAIALAPAIPARAAELSLVASNAIDAILEEVVPAFERTSGHKVTMRLGVARAVAQGDRQAARRSTSRSWSAISTTWSSKARWRRERRSRSAAAATGLRCVRARRSPTSARPKPSSAPCSMRSRSAIPRAAAAATYFVRLLDRLGIAEAMKPKLRPGTNMQAAVARGEVEMTVNGIVPILRVPGHRTGRTAAAGVAELQPVLRRRQRRRPSKRTPRWRC